jgi:spore coat polysaccharide biosynthesis protein SpsF (cytidylyltransferase family)
MRTAIVVCSRLNSSRVPEKAFAQVAGVPVLVHLLRRLHQTGFPVFVAVPVEELGTYQRRLEAWRKELPNLMIAGAEECPLQRMASVAQTGGFDRVVRVCHDKVFVDPDDVWTLLNHQVAVGSEYVYSSTLPAGSGFEIVSTSALVAAAERFRGRVVEHIGYAVRCVAERVSDADMTAFHPLSRGRLLLDYPEDLDVLRWVGAALGERGISQTPAQGVQALLEANWKWIEHNRMPLVTVYTCARNAERWIDKAMGSVAAQNYFGRCEYLLVDDGSTDGTLERMTRFAARFPNQAQVVKLGENVGLASASNVALSMARGQYILRLDADDFLLHTMILEHMVKILDHAGTDALYPANLQNGGVVQWGDEAHHIGGAMFRTRAMNHVKFTEGLRGYEGYDFFRRAQGQLQVSYYLTPTFFYRQRKGSLSRTDLADRERIRAEIDART